MSKEPDYTIPLQDLSGALSQISSELTKLRKVLHDDLEGLRETLYATLDRIGDKCGKED